jgi:CRP-like cAMP-binding protein
MQRCARWLLMASWRTERRIVSVTHDALAGLLGARRASVSRALGLLEESGALSGGRGWLEIRDDVELEAAGCGCYRAIREAYREALD